MSRESLFAHVGKKRAQIKGENEGEKIVTLLEQVESCTKVNFEKHWERITVNV